MRAIAAVTFIGLGLFQLLAILAGLEDWVGLHWIIAFPVALVLAYFPLVGTVVGMLGAVTVWGWSWAAAIALFFGPLAVCVLLAGVAGLMTNRDAVAN